MQQPKGNSGLRNTGNTCYLNSAIQAISNTDELREYLMNNREEVYNILLCNSSNIYKNINHVPFQLKQFLSSNEFRPENADKDVKNFLLNGTITVSLIKLLDALWNDNHTVLPMTFKQTFINRSKFNGHAQEDSQEAYSCIIQHLLEELGTKTIITLNTDNPIVMNIYETEKNMLAFMEHNASISKDHVMKTILEMKKNNPNEAVIVDFYNEKMKTMGNCYSKISELFTGFFRSTTECTDCGFVSNKFDSFLHIPLDLSNDMSPRLEDCMNNFCAESTLDGDNLWKCDNCSNKVKAKKQMKIWCAPKILVIQLNRFRMGTLRKDNRLVTFPFDNLDISNNISEENRNNIQSGKYQMYSVISHMGSMNHGHYFCYSRKNNDWYHFDDENVRRVMNAERSVMSPNSYILFYRRN